MRTQDELDEYVTRLIEDRRSRPADDLLTALIAAEEDGDRLSPSELVSTVEAVIVGGTDTTRNQLGCTVALFANHPDQWARLAEQPELAARAVEESMRYLGAIRGTARYVREHQYRDVVFPAGTFVFPSFTGANYDPGARSPIPTSSTSGSRRPPPQLTFGSGIHCASVPPSPRPSSGGVAHPRPPAAGPGPGRRHHVEAGDLRHLGPAAPALRFTPS
jgi:cytochrome P450